MKTIALLSIFLVLCACHSVRLTPEGQGVMVIRGVNSLSTECARIGTVVGQHKLGYNRALIIVQNKAAQLKADTVAIIRTEGWKTPSRRITANAFDCKERHVQPNQIMPSASSEDTQELFDKAKKCQSKGGVWVNDQCVVQVE